MLRGEEAGARRGDAPGAPALTPPPPPPVTVVAMTTATATATRAAALSPSRVTRRRRPAGGGCSGGVVPACAAPADDAHRDPHGGPRSATLSATHMPRMLTQPPHRVAVAERTAVALGRAMRGAARPANGCVLPQPRRATRRWQCVGGGLRELRHATSCSIRWRHPRRMARWADVCPRTRSSTCACRPAVTWVPTCQCPHTHHTSHPHQHTAASTDIHR